MEHELFKEETIYSVGSSRLVENSYEVIKNTIKNNDAVGFVTGHYDEQLSISNVSGFFLHNLGYDYKEFIEVTKGSLKNVFYGENKTFLEAERFQDMQGEGEGMILTKGKVPVYARLVKEDSFDEKGEKIWILSVHMDWMQQNLQLVNNVIQSGFWVIECDEQGRAATVNYSQEFRKMLGYNDVVDFPNTFDAWTDLIHPQDKKSVVDQLNAALADKTNQTKYDVEYRMKIRENKYEWFKDSAEITRRLDGTACRMAGIFINIQKQKEAENVQKLTEQNQAMDMMIKGTVKLVDRYATCDIEHDRYQFFNPGTGKNVYPPVGEYHDFIARINSNFKSYSGEYTIKQMLDSEHIQQALETPESVYKFEYCTKDEKQFKSLAISPLSWKNGKAESVLLIAQDITQEKMVEIQSRKALKEAYEAADRASRAKTEFLSNMSHDIRTPMNAIIGMTAIAGANIENQDRVLDCLSKITQSSRHLLGLINEVLDMSRIESGKISLSEEEFNLAELVDNLVTMIKPGIQMHQHHFEVHLNQIEHEDVCGDSLRIQQLVTNIMSNAIKYTPDGGNIDFGISEVDTASPDIGCYKFTIKDNGIGMSEEFQKVLFEPFTRADDKRTSKIQGTGLGMAIAKNIASMMNGSIDVESEPGKGTKFTITIYLKLQHKELKRIDELVDLPVLVVDDDKMCCESTVNILKEIGIDGEWVTSGKDAVIKVKERYQKDENYFAIIIDWQMPEMDGIETTRQIRKQVGSDVTIIILSAFDYSEIEEEAREAGVDDFIAKPLFRSRLTATLKNAIEGKTNKEAKNYLSSFAQCDFRGKNILLVEDNMLNSEIASEIIAMTGANIDTAENGKEALEKFSNAPIGFYDLIFMDIQMPTMNGYEATAAIRSLKKYQTKEVPIIAMTANAFAEDVVLAKNAGMNEHIAKPLEMNRLCEIMQRYL